VCEKSFFRGPVGHFPCLYFKTQTFRSRIDQKTLSASSSPKLNTFTLTYYQWLLNSGDSSTKLIPRGLSTFYGQREVQSEESSRIESTHIELLDDEPLARRLIRQRCDPKLLSETIKTARPKISTSRVNSTHDAGDSNQRDTTKFTLDDLKSVRRICIHGQKALPCAFLLLMEIHCRSILIVWLFMRNRSKQITPNSWRSISAYAIRCSELKKQPTFLGMRYLFTMNGTGKYYTVFMRNLDIISNPSSVNGCKNKWFLVKEGGKYDFNFPIHPGSRPPPEKEDERPPKKRFDTAKADQIGITPVPPLTKRSTLQPTGSRHSSERRPNPPPLRQPNYLASSLTLEDAKALLKRATVNADAVSRLVRLPDEWVASEFARPLALSLYHARNLIENHEKLLNSGSHMKLEGLKDYYSKEKKELKIELLRAKESAKRIEENLLKENQRLKDILKKTHEEIDQQQQRIQELEMDLAEAKNLSKEELLNSSSFKRRVAHFNATYYLSGLRVGVHQAVEKFQHLDPKIAVFEDDCGYEVAGPPPYTSPIRLGPFP
ncbi:hypothetical protein V2J09_012031, partial [Rumex salicifolius]